MNKSELVAAVAQSAGLTKKDAAAAVAATFDAIKAELAKKEKVAIIGFGTFETRKRPARTGRNPLTGENIKIAASYAPAFKAGKALKTEVNKKRRTTKK
ncbi:MAG: HU family DNA-binding protein [Clostridia bacterium]|nr:HU family DNA-binding protein [Clostridia bacterium]